MTTIKDSELRKMVKILLENTVDISPEAVTINQVVDPSAAVTNPENPNFVPQTKVELKIALNTLIDDLSDELVPSVYDSLKNVFQDFSQEQKEDSDENLEEVIRLTIRNLLVERSINEYFEKDPKTGKLVWKGSGPAPKLSQDAGVQKVDPGVRGVDAGPKTSAVKSLRNTLKKMKDVDFDDVDTSKPQPGRQRKNVTMQDGESFESIASELGYKNASGARQAVQKALEKAQFIGGMQPDELEILVLTSMNNYINQLSSSGQLSGPDVELLKSHPEIVRDLDGFREFLDKDIRAARKESKG